MISAKQQSVPHRILTTLLVLQSTWIVAGMQSLAADGGARARRETREFAISVDGINRGTCTVQIESRPDGSVAFRSETELRINFFVYKYRYSTQGTEVWSRDRLVSLDSVADYNGTKYTVKARAGEKGIRVAVDGHISNAAPDIWVTSYWQIPERLTTEEVVTPKGIVRTALSHWETPTGRPIALLDADQGKNLKGSLRRVGEETFEVAGAKRRCTHYRIVGDVQVEVWFDASRRLVWQQSKESGHTVRLELTRLEAN